MPRDYAKTSSRKKKSDRLPGWLWMIGGLTIGLFVAFLVYLNNSHSTAQGGLTKAIQDTIKDVREVRKDTPKALPQPSKPAAKTETEQTKSQPSFDFYYILPELEVPVPEQEIATKSRSDQPAQQDIEYILQVGSFRTHEQADQLKAKLALQGVEAKIQTVNINRDTWHRVRVGPINNMRTLDKTRRRLQDSGIAAIVIREKS